MHADQALLLPRDLFASVDLQDAAALLVSYGTVHMGVTARGRLQAGDTVLITAAGGGV